MKEFYTKRDMNDYIMKNNLYIYRSNENRYYVYDNEGKDKQVFLLPEEQLYEELY